MPADHQARVMWTLFEPIHALVYFAPQPRARFEEAGLRGFWRGYFAGRAAPLGAVAPAPVVAAFFSFAVDMVARAIPDVWQKVSPETVLALRSRGAVEALTAVSASVAAPALARAADLLEAATEELDCAGRVLAATNAALPRASRPLARLWQAATTLREHRGDGHVAALVAADLDGCEALVWRSSLDLSRDVLQPARGWTDEQWNAAAQRLVARGLLTPDGTATPAASRLHDQIESATDAAAARPWRRLGVAATEELVGLLSPIAAGCYPAMPAANPIGLQPPPWLVEATAG